MLLGSTVHLHLGTFVCMCLVVQAWRVETTALLMLHGAGSGERPCLACNGWIMIRAVTRANVVWTLHGSIRHSSGQSTLSGLWHGSLLGTRPESSASASYYSTNSRPSLLLSVTHH